MSLNSLASFSTVLSTLQNKLSGSVSMNVYFNLSTTFRYAFQIETFFEFLTRNLLWNFDICDNHISSIDN